MENNVIFIDIEKKMLTANGPVNLSIRTSFPHGELVALFGESGAGKTTLLRILAGLANPDIGVIRVGDTVWFDSENKINLSPQIRNISLMFQDYALFPNMTVEQNIRFAQPYKNDEEVTQLLKLFGITEFRNRKPNGLSGGQRQRVALARALARKPQLLLLDEPLSALDTGMRIALQNEILQAHQLLGVTSLIVSHDLSEVFRLASRVLYLQNGYITRSGTPEDVFFDRSISGKVQIPGQIVSIDKQETLYIVTVICGNNQIIKVTAFSSDLEEIKLGDKVMIFTKSFNPIIYRIG